MEQFQLAESADRVSSVNQSETQSAAEVFEDILCDYFDSLNIRFRRQEELLDEQKKSEGRAIITPDLLILSTPLETLNPSPLRPFDEQILGYFLAPDHQPLKCMGSVASSARVF